MDTIFQYEIPYLHPVAVHFPLVLIITAALTLLIWSVRGTAFWRRCSLLLLSLGMGTAFFAYFTGDQIEEGTEGVPIVDELVGLHEQFALYTLLATGVALLVMIGLSIWLERRTTLERDPKDPLKARLFVTILGLAAAVLVALTGHIGGTMVWGV